MGMLIMTNSSNGEGIYKELLETLLKNPDTPIEWEEFTLYDKLPPRPPLKQHKVMWWMLKLLDGTWGVRVPPDTAGDYASGVHLAVQENDELSRTDIGRGTCECSYPRGDDEFTFEVDAHGRATVMTLHTGGRDIPIKRLRNFVRKPGPAFT